jgi:hypothetical protein
MKKIKKVAKKFNVLRFVAIIATRLDMRLQPNRGSSFYRLPTRNKVPKEQRDWACPIGSLRLSDHWQYTNYNGLVVYKTDVEVPKYFWALAINLGPEYSTPWKVLQIFESTNDSIRKIDFPNIQKEIKKVLEEAAPISR